MTLALTRHPCDRRRATRFEGEGLQFPALPMGAAVERLGNVDGCHPPTSLNRAAASTCCRLLAAPLSEKSATMSLEATFRQPEKL